MAILPITQTVSRQIRATLPGSMGLPVVGHSFDFIKNPTRMGLEMYSRYGEIFWLNALGSTYISMVGPDANQLVFRNQGDIFSNSKGWEYYIGHFFRRGIMLLDFEEHRYHRGIMQAAFKKPVLMQYLEHMNPAIERGISRWQTGNNFEVLTHIKQLTLDIATDIFMGESLGPEADIVNKAFVDCVRAGTAIVRYPVPGGRWKKGFEGRKVLEDFFQSRVAAKRRNPGNDLFSRLCQAEDEQGRKFSDDDVVNHMIFLMMAAHDTSTITLCSMFYQLARNPDWQNRLREESSRLGTLNPTHDELGQMEQAGWVMKEAMRLIPPVHGIPRMTVKDVEFKGYHIPAGSMLAVSPLLSHRLKEWWVNPERFDPERFSESRNEHKKHMYQYIPFGGGAHMCIGLHFAEMQVKAILHHVLQKYRWSTAPAYEMPVDFTSLPVPGDRLPVRLERI